MVPICDEILHSLLSLMRKYSSNLYTSDYRLLRKTVAIAIFAITQK